MENQITIKEQSGRQELSEQQKRLEQDALEHKTWIGGRVEVLLEHFWRPDVDDQVQDAITVDWVKALKGYSRDTIETAVADYLATDNKRPKIADICFRCRKLTLRTPISHLSEVPAPRARPDPDRTRQTLEDAGFKVGENGRILSVS